MTIQERFWNKVKKTRGCWVWIGAISSSGYGAFGFNKRVLPAHRVSWILTHDVIPEGLHVLHRCDNPLCVRPEHLFLGTHQDNMIDKIKKQRGNSLQGEEHGDAKLTEKQVKEIRRKYSKTRTRYLKEIAKDYGVTFSTIYKILLRQTWKHVFK